MNTLENRIDKKGVFRDFAEGFTIKNLARMYETKESRIEEIIRWGVKLSREVE